MKKIRKLIFLPLLLICQSSIAYQFDSEREGFELMLEEIATLESLVTHIENAPKMPGRFSVDYERLRSDLQIIKRGIEDVTNNPISIERKLEMQSPINGDYLK